MKTNSGFEVLLVVLLLVACAPAAISAETAAPLPTSTSLPSVYGLLFSPDGSMKVQSHDWKTYDMITEDETILWSFTYDADKYEKFGVDPRLPIFTEAGWYPIHWSKDGKFVYMSVVHGGEGNSSKFVGNAFTDGTGIFKFDVETGVLTEIIPEIYPGYYAFSFSPDSKQLLYANQTETPVKVKLLNLATLQEKTIITGDDNVLEIGAFGLSPNQEKLVYSELKQKYDISVIDLASLEKQSIITDFEHHLSFENWIENYRVRYHDTNRAIWELDLNDKIVMPLAVPTLTLAP